MSLENNLIELIDYGREAAEVDYAHMIQSFHRFLVEHLSSEDIYRGAIPVVVNNPVAPSNPMSPTAAPFTQLLGIDAKNLTTCTNCQAVRGKDNLLHIVDLTYPRKVPLSTPLCTPCLDINMLLMTQVPSNETQPPQDFVSILRSSLLRQLTHKATCQSCKHFSTFVSRRSIPTKDLPHVLAVNAGVHTEESMRFWLDKRNETFLKPRIELHGQVAGVDDPEAAIYELRVCLSGASRILVNLDFDLGGDTTS